MMLPIRTMTSPVMMTLRLPNVSLRYPARAAEHALAMDQEPTTHGCFSIAPNSRVTWFDTDARDKRARPMGAPSEMDSACIQE